jgi:glucokinase
MVMYRGQVVTPGPVNDVMAEGTEASVAVLEIGGTHVTAALVQSGTWDVRPGTLHRRPLRASASAEQIISDLLAAADDLDAGAGTRWGVATPGPFDYRRGVALFRGVGKFDALYGYDVGATLLRCIKATPRDVTFVDDAEAFLVGEWLTGAAKGAGRCVGVTVGTGIGSGFLTDGHLVDDGPHVPPGGRVHRLVVDGVPLEDLVSRRAIVRRYRQADDGSGPDFDVKEIAAAARAGDARARDIFETAFRTLGAVVAPWLQAFGAELLVVGGSISRSWDLIAGPLADGLATGDAGQITVRAGLHLDTSPVVGAAWVASRPVEAPGANHTR